MQGLGSGACCVTALIEGQEVVISNLGDCRAVLCRRGVAEALTRDHRVEQEDERKRIEDKVCVVVWSNLAVLKGGARIVIDGISQYSDTGRICRDPSRSMESSWGTFGF